MSRAFLPPEQVEAILRCRKSVLFHNAEAWIRKSGKGAFDVTRGYFNGAEVFELIDLYILNKINEIVHKDNHGL